MYKVIPLTLKHRVEIPVGAVVEVEVNEVIEVPEGSYGMFFIRKSFAVKGVNQLVLSPFKSGWCGLPEIVVQNNHVAPVPLNADEEIGELWIYD